ncbi:Venom carboxylesterase6like, partial [Caligus rogercresseyi]
RLSQTPMNAGPISDNDKIVGQNTITMWINFARTGNPTPIGYFLDDNSKWLSIQESNGCGDTRRLER